MEKEQVLSLIEAVVDEKPSEFAQGFEDLVRQAITTKVEARKAELTAELLGGTLAVEEEQEIEEESDEEIEQEEQTEESEEEQEEVEEPASEEEEIDQAIAEVERVEEGKSRDSEEGRRKMFNFKFRKQARKQKAEPSTDSEVK